MNKEIKQKWTSALRSGDYKQGGGQLYNPKTNCYCVLGVLFDTLGYSFSGNGVRLKNVDTGYITVAERLGVPNSAGIFNMNDKGYDFSSLADYIDENIPEE